MSEKDAAESAPVVKSFAGSMRDDRCLEVWFADKVTDATRAWLLEAINDKALRVTPSGNDPVAPEKGWLKPALDKAADRAAEMPHWMTRLVQSEKATLTSDAIEAIEIRSHTDPDAPDVIVVPSGSDEPVAFVPLSVDGKPQWAETFGAETSSELQYPCKVKPLYGKMASG